MENILKHSHQTVKEIVLTGFLAFVGMCAMCQVISPPSDTLQKKDSIPKVYLRSKIQSYTNIITNKYITHRGLFSVHQLQDTIYFEIPNSILHRDIEVINRLIKGPGGTGVFSGEELDEHTIEFEKGPDSTIRIRYDLIVSQADSGSEIYKAVQNCNLNPIVISFPIKAFSPDSSSCIIDVSKFLKDKTFVNSIDPGSGISKSVNIGGLRDFYIESVHAYPINVEISISKNTDSRIPGFPPGTPVTLETHTSFIELPERPMPQRAFDPRVGFFADQVYAFDDHQQKTEDRRFILRWRLEPKDEDIEKWKRGELVEPKKQIIIYIDPATPKQWRPFLIQGINDWQKAFEQAGFKNAIVGKEWPEYNPLMQMDDARYSFINYLPSETENAYGPNVHDPRSGEIIQTHIGWYHNVMQLLHDWYFIQAAATDARARHARFSDELMGELIRFVSSHEVGHTLGLRHNFGSSSQTPVDSLRSVTYLDAHGHTASIMDYARFDYVAQPEDHIPGYDLFPRVGEYDKWAIEWGYKSSGAPGFDDDKKIMRRLIVDSIAANPRLWYGSGENKNNTDPRCQTEDLGDDAMKASAYGIKNLRRILPNLPEWSHEEGGMYNELDEMYKALENQYFRYMQHVMMNIGGVYSTTQSEDKKGDVYAPVPVAKEKEALVFFDRELFTTPYWILDSNVTNKVSLPAQPNFIEDLQVKALNKLLDIGKINQLLANSRQFGDKALAVDDYLNTIHQIIWKELKSGKAIDPYRRNLQKSYVGALQEILTSNKAEVIETDVYSIARADFVTLQGEVHQAILKQTDAMSRHHLQDLEVRIKNILEAKISMQ
jgi:hypothetical protein